MVTLFSIGADLLALNDLCDELPGGEMSPEAEAAFDAWAAKLAEDEATKLDGYCGLIRSLEGEAAVARSEAEQYLARAAARENRVKWLKARMKLHLESTGRTKAVTATGRTVAIQANGGKVPVWIDPAVVPADLPAPFQRVRVEVDTEAIRANLESGHELSFARLEPRGTHLRVRT